MITPAEIKHWQDKAKVCSQKQDILGSINWLSRAASAAPERIDLTANLVRVLLRQRLYSESDSIVGSFVVKRLRANDAASAASLVRSVRSWTTLPRFHRMLGHTLALVAAEPNSPFADDPLQFLTQIGCGDVAHGLVWPSDRSSQLLGRSASRKAYSEQLTTHYFSRVELGLRERFNARDKPSLISKRIAIVANSLAMGGNERNASTMAILLSQLGDFEKVFLVYGDKRIRDEHFKDSLEKSNVEVISVLDEKYGLHSGEFAHILGNPFSRLLDVVDADEVGRLNAVFREHDITHVHSFASDRRNAQVALASIGCAMASVAINPGSMSPFGRIDISDERTQSFKAIFRAVCGAPAMSFYCCSLAALTGYARWLECDPDLLKVNYVGMNVPGRTRRESQALTVGGAFRFHDVKQPRLWIETAISLAQEYPDIRFSLAGDGEELELCKRLIENAGISGRVDFLGATKNMEEFYANIDLFLLCSKSEGLGNVLIEAQSFGVPVVAPAVGGMPECVVQYRSGIIVRDATVGLLAEALKTFIDNSEFRRACGEFGRRFVSERFGRWQMYMDMRRAWDSN